MKLSEHKELKKEILGLPPKEKDKLLLRLVAKDKVLTEHLHFLLLEDESSLGDRVEEIKEQIMESMHHLRGQRNLNAKDVLVNLRKLAKIVNHNLKVTKANFEDVELRVFLLNHTITEFKTGIFSSFKNYEHVFASYYVKSILVTLRKFDKLHQDLQFDLSEELNKLLIKANGGSTASVAHSLNLPGSI